MNSADFLSAVINQPSDHRRRDRMEKLYLADTDSLKKKYESLAGRNQEIDDTFISLYADKAKGILTEIKRYAAITELDEIVLNRLINCILIGESEKTDGVKTQEVRIVYNFVGEL